tara:strand:- start:58570 stop:59679 length:1110 start_codon:yes stop_codon:yes gene_type:complete
MMNKAPRAQTQQTGIEAKTVGTAEHRQAQRRPTQKDVAIQAGVTQATVSMALSRHPSISDETCDRIRTIADSVGYRPDPYLTGLSAYRKQMKAPVFQATIAWLSNWHEPTSHNWSGVAGLYYEGALKRAHELGYEIEEHALLSPDMTPKRMEQIMLNRNIKGILLPPQSKPGSTMDQFCFDKFSTVTFGYTLASPQFHIVSLHHHRSVKLLFHELVEKRGYRRPGLCVSMQEDIRTDRIWSAAFWSEQRYLPSSHHVPIHMDDTWDKDRFMDWFSTHRPDVIISSNKKIHQWLNEAGIAVPEAVGIAMLTKRADDTFYSGIWQNLRKTGTKALDLLVDMIHRGERGLPDVRMNVLIDASWVDGNTVRSV